VAQTHNIHSGGVAQTHNIHSGGVAQTHNIHSNTIHKAQTKLIFLLISFSEMIFN